MTVTLNIVAASHVSDPKPM